jgi:UDP-N-acetylglucosamine 2-epimerase (non-hydrolysing)
MPGERMDAPSHIVTIPMGTRCRVAVVLGTRPEAIKMAPVVRALDRRDDRFERLVITTSQHREMLAQAMGAMGLRADLDLGLTHINRTLAEFTAHALLALQRALAEIRPHLLLVQGDTSTVASAALAAFYQGIPIGHVEAGLRSGDMRRPFPEEANRRIASVVTDLHFAPTETARANLLREGIPTGDVFVTGNTVVDALQSVPARARFDEPALDAVDWHRRRVLLVTVHRRENLGENLHDLCRAFKRLVMRHQDIEIVFPVHLNPAVREVVFAELHEVPGITLLDPISYPDLLEVMRRCYLVLSDSGGIQEEAPALQKPILILRNVTERPEVVQAGFGRLVGTDSDAVATTTSNLLQDPAAMRRMTAGRNPFGDGRAAERIVRIVEQRFGLPIEHRAAAIGA